MADFESCDIHFDKREFSIVGDALFIRTLEEAPLWLKTSIENQVDLRNSNYQTTLQNYSNNLLTAFNQIDVAKNTYDSYINKFITNEQAIVSKIDTLQSSVNNNDASIRSLLTTYATEDFAVSTALNTLSASINSAAAGSVGAAISSAESALATQYGSLAQRLDTLESTYEFIDEDVTGTANAIQDLKVYTGYGTVGGTPALISESGFYTDLNAQLVDIENNISANANSVLGLDSRVTINKEGVTNVSNSFFYDSMLKIGSNYHYSGFGLESIGSGTGTELDPFTSEFWVNAQKFKFTNTNKSGSVAPFTIDASGTTPQVTFNGIVSFTNVTDAPTIPEYTSQLINNSGYVLPSGVANAINTNTTTIDGSKITAGSLYVGTAEIANAAITRAKIASATITDAEIANAAITNAKIRNASVDTLKIGSDAVTIPVSSNGTYSASVSFYAPVSMSAHIMGVWTQGTGREGIYTNIYHNGNLFRRENPQEGTLGTMAGKLDLTVGTHTFILNTDSGVGEMRCSITVLGVKR